MKLVNSLLIQKIIRQMTLWLWGGFIYFCIELLWRGYSHPSMFAVGGIALITVGGINNYLPWRMNIIIQSLIGGIIITCLELVSGLIVNIWLNLSIWDYSDKTLNILGQVCLQYFFAWVFLALIGIFLDDFLRWKIYGEQTPEYRLI